MRYGAAAELFNVHGRSADLAFALALASSLARGGSGAGAVEGTEDTDDKDRDVWRPDGKGRRGLEEDYDYVMYGKVSLILLSCQQILDLYRM